jgi:hypothetical protein
LKFTFDKGPLELEDDFLIRVRHFMSSEIRYPILRVFLSPALVFSGATKIPATFIDFGDGIEVSENFFVEIEVDVAKERLSNCYLKVSAVLKNSKHAGGRNFEGVSGVNDELTYGLIGETKHAKSEQPKNEDMFSIGDDEEETRPQDKEENLVVEDKKKIVQLIEMIQLNKAKPEPVTQSETNEAEPDNAKVSTGELVKPAENEEEEEDDDEEYLKALESNA